jgi:CheY-like chemotaxis protein
MTETAGSLAPGQDAKPGCSGKPNPVSRSASRQSDRRGKRRASLCAPLRVRGVNITAPENPDEVVATVNVSRIGLLFLTRELSYHQGMEVAVTFPYSKTPGAIQAEQSGRVARVLQMADGRRAVALALGKPAVAAGEPPVLDTACPKSLDELAPSCAAALPGDGQPDKPLILFVDSDDVLRDSLKAHLVDAGYHVIAVNNAADAREILNMFTPALLVAEVEGEGLPGFDLCAHVKANTRLRQIPVVLTTNSAYPTDYANAHSLGAIVCMAKPYKPERMGHIARLLVPKPQTRQQTQQRAGGANAGSAAPRRAIPASPRGSQRRWRFPFS